MHLQLDGITLANGLARLPALWAAKLLADSLPELLADIFRENVTLFGVLACVNDFCGESLVVVCKLGRLIGRLKLGQRPSRLARSLA